MGRHGGSFSRDLHPDLIVIGTPGSTIQGGEPTHPREHDGTATVDVPVVAASVPLGTLS